MSQSTTLSRLFFSIVFAIMLSVPALAHRPNQSILYLQVYEDQITARFELAFKDANKVFDFQLEEGMAVEDLQQYTTIVKQYYTDRVSCFALDGTPYKFQFADSLAIGSLGGRLGDYILLNCRIEGITQIPDALRFDYRVLFDKDPTHEGFLVVEHNWKAGIVNNESIFSAVFSEDEPVQELDLTDRHLMKGFLKLIKLGIKHILIGLDHILFIFALVLPSVITRQSNGTGLAVGSDRVLQIISPQITSWSPLARFKPAFINILKVVTFFTLAHTVTLSLAALEIVQMPSKLVESVIAFSIAMAAFHNIRPIFQAKEWMIAFGFGLFHGFGFANVLQDYGLSDFLAYSLLGFNIGVEIGQVAVIAITFPILFLLRKSKIFPKLLVYGSIGLIIIAFYWVVGRVFELDLPGDDIVVQLYRLLKSLIS